jgi:hypothetical protein
LLLRRRLVYGASPPAHPPVAHGGHVQLPRAAVAGLLVYSLFGAADAYALDALPYSNQPLDADAVELAPLPGQPLDLAGPLGQVLAKAHPRLIVVTSAPPSPSSEFAQEYAGPDASVSDADAAATLGALIYRVDSAGAMSLSGETGKWSLSG